MQFLLTLQQPVHHVLVLRARQCARCSPPGQWLHHPRPITPTVQPPTLARVNPWSLGTASSAGASPPPAARSRSLFFLMRSAALAQWDSTCSSTASSWGSGEPAGCGGSGGWWVWWCCDDAVAEMEAGVNSHQPSCPPGTATAKFVPSASTTPTPIPTLPPSHHPTSPPKPHLGPWMPGTAGRAAACPSSS